MTPMIYAALSAAFQLIADARKAGATDEEIERVRVETDAKVNAAVAAIDAAWERGTAQ